MKSTLPLMKSIISFMKAGISFLSAGYALSKRVESSSIRPKKYFPGSVRYASMTIFANMSFTFGEASADKVVSVGTGGGGGDCTTGEIGSGPAEGTVIDSNRNLSLSSVSHASHVRNDSTFLRTSSMLYMSLLYVTLATTCR